MERDWATFALEEGLYDPDPEFERLLGRISMDAGVLFGKPRIAGTRISVAMILGLLRSGRSFDQIVEGYPPLTTLDIQAALAYAESLLPWPERDAVDRARRERSAAT